MTRVRDSARYTFFEITITEGRNRQIRRMVEALGAKALGAKALKLVRIRIGPIEIGGLNVAHSSQARDDGPGFVRAVFSPLEPEDPATAVVG